MKELKLSISDLKFKGKEPKPVSITTEGELIDCYNWYNYFYDKSIWKDWTIQYNKMIGNKFKIESASESNFINSIGAKARLILNGTKLDEKYVVKLHEQLKEIESEVRVTKKPNPIVKETHDKIKNYETIVADIEEKLDEFYLNDYSSNFSLYNFLSKNQLSKSKAQSIFDYYLPILEDVVNHKADYCRTEKQYKRYVAFLLMLVNDAKKFIENKKQARKPRKRKELKLEDKVKAVSYKKENVTLKLASIKPENVIGSSIIVMYNDKYRYVSVLYAENGKFLEIKGTTIINVDGKKSFMKTVRKPETLNTLLSGGQKAVLKNINDIVAKSKINASGRINSETLLLKAYK